MTTEHRSALARTWRPKSFDSVVGQEHVVRALSNALNHQLLHHAYLFTGTRGVGKTTLARILAKCLNCETQITSEPCGQCEHCQEIDNGRFPDLYEIDAASRTKVEDTRDILDNIQYAPIKGRFKIYLIDEVHMLSGHSFNALLKTLEEPPEHVKFLLATTDPQKLPATVLSRCLQFHLTHMPEQDIANHFQHILSVESVHAETEALQLLAKAARGSMRDGLSLLDQSIAYGNNQILTAEVKKMLGSIDQSLLLQILQHLCEQDANGLLNCSANLASQGADFQLALTDLLSLLHQLTILQVAAEAQHSNPSSDLQAIAAKLPPEEVQLYYQIALLGKKDLPIAPNAQIGFEMTLLRMLAFTPNQTTDQPHHIKTIEKKAKPVAASTSPAAPTEWLHVIKQLALPGATTALLRACVMESLNDTELLLSLEPSHEALLNQKHIDRVNQALGSKIRNGLRVTIKISASDKPTANQSLENKKKQEKIDSKASLMADKNIQSIMKNFDAEVINDSIASNQET